MFGISEAIPIPFFINFVRVRSAQKIALIFLIRHQRENIKKGVGISISLEVDEKSSSYLLSIRGNIDHGFRLDIVFLSPCSCLFWVGEEKEWSLLMWSLVGIRKIFWAREIFGHDPMSQ